MLVFLNCFYSFQLDNSGSEGVKNKEKSHKENYKVNDVQLLVENGLLIICFSYP